MEKLRQGQVGVGPNYFLFFVFCFSFHAKESDFYSPEVPTTSKDSWAPSQSH